MSAKTMLFTSWQFILVFLPVILLAYFVIPVSWVKARKVWLIVASFYFYAYWRIEFVFLLLLSLAFNFGLAELMTRRRGRRTERQLLMVGVAVNLLLLGYYKYTNFLLSALGWMTQRDFGRFEILLPLAISFFTFTQIGYLVDVSRDPKLRYSLLDYALFVVFFPHLIAGPIVRHWEIIPQFTSVARRLNQSDLGTGLALFLIGLSKKVLLADSVAVYANAVYGAAQAGAAVSSTSAWLGTVAFALQIYFDFSGYSDMAIGLARLFSIRFPRNFDSPYQASNLVEFWRRWHISLTRFLREYVYFPLGGNRCAPSRQACNLLITFLLSGLWHGAGWTFIIWGAMHGCGLVVVQRWQTWSKRTGGWLRHHWSSQYAAVLLTFTFVLFSWVYFRAPDTRTAHRVLSSMLAQGGLTFSREALEPDQMPGRLLVAAGLTPISEASGMHDYSHAIGWISALLLLVWCFPNSQQLLQAYEPVLEEHLRPARWHLALGTGTGLALGVLMFFLIRQGYAAVPSPFLYFNF